MRAMLQTGSAKDITQMCRLYRHAKHQYCHQLNLLQLPPRDLDFCHHRREYYLTSVGDLLTVQAVSPRLDSAYSFVISENTCILFTPPPCCCLGSEGQSVA